MENTLPPINQRIKNLIDDKFGGIVSSFCKELGLESPQKINRLFKLDVRSKNVAHYPTPSTDILEVISNKFDISLDELVKGVKPKPMNNEQTVPFYESDVTGSLVGSFSDIKEEPAFYVDFKPFNDCVAYFPIYGDSMYPRFASGEIVAVKEIQNKNTIQWGEAHLVITDASENNMKTVKTVHPYEKDDSCIILRATNPNFKGDTIIKKSAIINMYLVKGKIRKDQI